MTNREKYKEEILDVVCRGERFGFDKRTRQIVPCIAMNCSECKFDLMELSCPFALEQWCSSEYKEPEIDWSKVKVDTPVLVGNFATDMSFIKRYFAKYENGLVYVWKDGKTSWTAKNKHDIATWGFTKLAESEE